MGQPVGRVGRQPLADHPSEREATKCELRDVECIRDGECVAGEELDAVIAGRDVARAMASEIVTERAKVRLEGVGLRVPLGVIAAERVREHQDGAIVGAVESVVVSQSADVNERHA